jgi:hypothetical protein
MRHIARALYVTAAAAIALTTAGFAGAGSPATAAPSLGPPVYTSQDAGYASTGRWFRYVQATVKVPPVIPSADYPCNLVMTLRHAGLMGPRVAILVRQGGGAGSVGWAWGGRLTPFAISPNIGDQVRASIYYDRDGHIYFTAADVTQGVTRTVKVNTGAARYNEVTLLGNADGGPVPSPAADTRLWAVSGTRLTTYTGARGTVTGPWHTSELIQTSTGTAAGTVYRSPSGLWNGAANFGVWLRHH